MWCEESLPQLHGVNNYQCLIFFLNVEYFEQKKYQGKTSKKYWKHVHTVLAHETELRARFNSLSPVYNYNVVPFSNEGMPVFSRTNKQATIP